MSLARGDLFTTLNLFRAYQQLLWDEESLELVLVSRILGCTVTAAYCMGLSLSLQSSRELWISC